MVKKRSKTSSASRSKGKASAAAKKTSTTTSAAAAAATTAASTTAMKEVVSSMTYQDLLNRKEEIQQRLSIVAIEPIKKQQGPTTTTTTVTAAANNNNNNKSPSSRSSKRNRQQQQQSTTTNSNEQQQLQQASSLSTEADAAVVPIVVEKTIDVHWDYTIKEMMWLATDFQAERKRQISQGKKIATAIKQYFKTRETRRLRELAEAELKRRRLGAKIGREVKGWWTKIERVIAYKQKCSADEQRRLAMNRQLVTLVKQTEKYTESLIHQQQQEEEELEQQQQDDDDDGDSVSSQEDNNNKKRKGRKKRHNKRRRHHHHHHHHAMSIEEALALGDKMNRRSKNRVVDYNRLQLKADRESGEDQLLYGESTASDTGSDGSYSPGEDSDEWSTDDETTLKEAEALETKERLMQQKQQQQARRQQQQQQHHSNDYDDDQAGEEEEEEEESQTSFTADPRELKALKEESDMPIDEVLERYREEAEKYQLLLPQQEEQAEEMIEQQSTTTTPPTSATATATAKTSSPMEVDDEEMEGQKPQQNNNGNNNRGDSATATAAAGGGGGGASSKQTDNNVEQSTSTTVTAMEVEEDVDNDNADADADADAETVKKEGKSAALSSPPSMDSNTSIATLEQKSTKATSTTNTVQFTDDNNNNNNNNNKSEEQEDSQAKSTTAAAGPPAAATRKRVTFAAGSTMKNSEPNTARTAASQEEDASARYDADDDGDASDVEDFVVVYDGHQSNNNNNNNGQKDNDDDDGSDEFEADQDEVDDETTMAQEEALPQEMSAEDEIKLLQAENEMSIEELRRMYAGVLDGTAAAAATTTTTKEGSKQTAVTNTSQQQAPTTATIPDGGDRVDSPSLEAAASSDTNSARDDDDGSGEDEFEADPNEVDDETTMAQEEALPQEISAEEEIKLLQAENEMSVEELRKLYAGAFQETNDSNTEDLNDEHGKDPEEDPSSEGGGLEEIQNAADEEVAEEEFVPEAGGDVDDETTMEAEEKLGRDMTYEEELALLKNENEIPVEQLRAMYASVLDGTGASEDDDGDDSDKEISEDGDIDTKNAEPSSKRQRVGEPSLAEAMQEANNEDGTDAEEEFQPEAGDEMDDETTIEAEERLGRDMSYEDEIALLNKENEMSVDELRAKYAGALTMEKKHTMNNGTKSDHKKSTGSSLQQQLALANDNESENAEHDADFVADADEVDDETTMEAEERLGRDMTPEEELAMLKRESETPIESLYEMYQKMEAEQAATESHSGAADEDDAKSSDDGDSSKRKRKRIAGADSPDDNPAAKRAKEEEADEGLAAIQALEKSAERARKTLASRPFLLAPWVKLRAYQQTGLNWLVQLQTRRLNGILADEMGLGKTLQTISLLAYLASYKGIWGPHLVIVPTSVIVNWETELKRFCPGMKALCYYGSAKRRKELRSGWTKTNWYHVVVTSYQLAVQDAFAFKRKRWYYLILDEAQNIKNFQSQRWQTLINFNTQRRLLLTGTPLQNNLMELWSLLHFLMPYIFRSRKEFSFWFSNPMNSMIEGTANQNDEMIARLHGIIRPFVLRRLKKDVETQLPGKYEHIVKCPLSRRQMFFYEEFMSRSSTRQALKKGGNYMGMMNVLMQLRKVCNHPDLFEPRSVVTPFVLNPLSMPVPDCVPGVTTTKHVFRDLSQHLMSPLWCGSTANASIKSSLDHDELRSQALMELEDNQPNHEGAKSEDFFEAPSDIPPALRELLHEIGKTANKQRKSKFEFQLGINGKRCGAPPFSVPSRLLQAVRVKRHAVYELEEDFLSTPSQMLAIRRSQQERAEDVDDMIKNFVFCVPKAGAPPPVLEIRTCQNEDKTMEELLLEPAEQYLRPFRQAHARLTSFFPDKKLVQFDAGKLQTLADLLHDLKRGGHRVLIFTQMSKMLDILEAFLNLNGHTYVRLDGSTGVDRRQRLMDRFNNDTKIFSFILSTRSGGMGINLTGADTVIFYDSDWNPAMDAQAQDRAHRIGQTRDVHIYRLITEHSIEENILIKAQQKRNLDIIVMDKGKFDGSTTGKAQPEPKAEEPSDVFTKGGLRAILGVDDDKVDPSDKDESQQEEEKDSGESITREQMEAAMTNLEDQDDVIALRGAQKEAAEELREFDESIELKKDSDNEGDDEDADNKPSAKGKAKAEKTEKKPEESAPEQKSEEEELAKEFAAWQDNVGLDTSALEASLSPTEKYGLNFRQEIDPFYSVFAIMEERRRLEASEETKEEIDIDQIERDKATEERRAIDDGDLLGTQPRPEDLVRQRNLYQREKARLKADKKRRTLTGENWEVREDGRSKKPFWYNADTGEALWDKPRVLVELEAEEAAREKMWTALPLKPLVHIMSFLVPYPERIQCTKVCRRWRLAANDFSFVRHIYPVEQGAMVRDEKHIAYNHYRTIADALLVALPGDTIEFGDGHYWVNEPGLSIDFPLKFVGDEHNASNVTIEMSGTISWNANAGWMEGITFRRPKISSGEGSKDDMLLVKQGGKLDIVESVIDNTGSSSASSVAIEGTGCRCRWEGVIISGGIEQGIKVGEGSKIDLKKCIIRANRGNGISCNKSELTVCHSRIIENEGYGATIHGGAASFLKCHFDRNGEGIIKQEDGCKLHCSQNTSTAEALSKQNMSGFQAAISERKA